MWLTDGLIPTRRQTDVLLCPEGDVDQGYWLLKQPNFICRLRIKNNNISIFKKQRNDSRQRQEKALRWLIDHYHWQSSLSWGAMYSGSSNTAATRFFSAYILRHGHFILLQPYRMNWLPSKKQTIKQIILKKQLLKIYGGSVWHNVNCRSRY